MASGGWWKRCAWPGSRSVDGEAARDHADAGAVAAALRFAERRKIGPYARTSASDPKEREKALSAMVRAGHGFGLSRAIVGLAAGAEVDADGTCRGRRRAWLKSVCRHWHAC